MNDLANGLILNMLSGLMLFGYVILARIGWDTGGKISRWIFR